MGQRANIIHVELLRHFVAALRDLRQESSLLFRRIVQFRKAIGDFHPRHVNLEALRQGRIVWLLLRQRRNVGRIFVQNRWLNQLVFRNRFKQQARPFAIGQFSLCRRIFRMVRLRPHVIAFGRLRCASGQPPVPLASAPRPRPAGQYFTIASRMVSVASSPKSSSCSPYFTMRRARDVLRHLREQLLVQLHQIPVIAVRLIKLQHRELGIVLRAKSLHCGNCG